MAGLFIRAAPCVCDAERLDIHRAKLGADYIWMSADFGCEALCSAVSIRNAAVSMKLAECLVPLSQDVWMAVNRCGSSWIICLFLQWRSEGNIRSQPALKWPPPQAKALIKRWGHKPLTCLPARSEHERKGNREETPHQDTSGPIVSNMWGLNFGGSCM